MIWHPRRTVSYLRMQGQGWGWELFLAALLVTWLSLVLSPLPVVEWSMSKDFSPLAGEIILDNLQTLRCTITGLTTVRLLLTDVPSPASHTGILVADAYSPRDGRHPVLWQQLPFVKCDMSGIHNLSLTEGEADSMKHFVGCHVLRDQKETGLMRALEAVAFWIAV